MMEEDFDEMVRGMTCCELMAIHRDLDLLEMGEHRENIVDCTMFVQE